MTIGSTSVDGSQYSMVFLQRVQGHSVPGFYVTSMVLRNVHFLSPQFALCLNLVRASNRIRCFLQLYTPD